jgi:hypothetical protein
LFQDHFARFVQNTVTAGAISQIQTDRLLVILENLHPRYRHGANLLHCRSPFAPRARRSLGAYRIPLETGLLIPSDKSGDLNGSTQHSTRAHIALKTKAKNSD